jgi:hypothetical protein
MTRKRGPRGTDRVFTPPCLVDHRTRTYRFLQRNHHWKALDQVDNERNKRRIDGHSRILRDGRRRIFRFARS